MVVRAERLLGVSPFDLLFAKRGKGGKEKKKPKKVRKEREPLGWFERLRRRPSLPGKLPEKEPGRTTDFVRAHRMPKRKRQKDGK